MIDSLTQRDLQRLAGEQKAPCVSLYMQTDRIGSDALQNAIRLKNLLAEAEERLISLGQRPVAAKGFLRPIGELLDNRAIWSNVSSGLAVFRSAEALHAWRLPAAFEPYAWVGDRFFIKPLLPLATHDDRFYLLAVSQNGVRLFEGSRYELGEIHVSNLPKGLVEALHFHPPEGLLQVRTVSTAVHGKEGAVFHGQGAATEHRKDDILAYFRIIDQAFHAFLKNEQSHLLFAGVEYLFPIYCRANTYPGLVEKPITGNVSHLHSVELHRKASEILTPIWHRVETKDRERFRRAAGRDHVSGDLKEILRAAREERIEALFVASDVEPWGHFDPATGHVELAAPREPGSEELLDLATSATLKGGGRVYSVKSADLPEGRLASALFRYSAVAAPA